MGKPLKNVFLQVCVLTASLLLQGSTLVFGQYPDHCGEKISMAEHKADFLKEATKTALEVLKDANEKMDALEKSEKRMKELEDASGSSLTAVDDTSLCGQWTSYKEEKCLKIVEVLGTVRQEDAGKACTKLSAQLLTIKTKEEQETLQQFLFTKNELVDNVWLGLKKESSGQFEWNDGSQMTFSNWANQTVVDEQNECVEMKSGGGFIPAGLWVKVTCKRKNAVVCQKRPTWNLITLQNAFLNFKLEQQKKSEEAKAKNSLLENQIKQNRVPVGFIYFQLPHQQTPDVLWPETHWVDLSTNYSGLFLRIAGENAAEFGNIQEENSPKLTAVANERKTGASNIPVEVPSDGTWSNSIWTGENSGTNQVYLKFKMSTGEVRPRNQAIRIWQRTR